MRYAYILFVIVSVVLVGCFQKPSLEENPTPTPQTPVEIPTENTPPANETPEIEENQPQNTPEDQEDSSENNEQETSSGSDIEQDNVEIEEIEEELEALFDDLLGGSE